MVKRPRSAIRPAPLRRLRRNVYIFRRKANNKVYETYYCNHKHLNYRKSLLDQLVLDAAEDLLTGEKYETAKRKLLSIAQTESQKEDNRDAIYTEIARIDKKIDNITDAIADAPHSAALLLKLADLEAKRDNLTAILQKPVEARFEGLDDVQDNLRDSTLSVLKSEKSSTEDLRTALSLFISAVTLYPNGEVSILYSIPGFANFGGKFGGNPTAPPEGQAIFSQITVYYSMG